MDGQMKKAKTEYLRGGIGYRALAEKHGIDLRELQATARKEGWVKQKREAQKQPVTLLPQKKDDRAERLQSVADLLMDKLEIAVGELNIQLEKHTEKEKIIEYEHPDRPEKPTREVVSETSTVRPVETVIDRKGLHEIAATLKTLKDIQMLRSEADIREQEAKIRNLERQAEKAAEDNGIEIVLSPEAEVLAQ